MGSPVFLDPVDLSFMDVRTRLESRRPDELIMGSGFETKGRLRERNGSIGNISVAFGNISTTFMGSEIIFGIRGRAFEW
jgi:hypothetical protein